MKPRSTRSGASLLMDLSPELIATLVRLPLESIRREFPNKMDHVLNGPEDVRGPRDLHPAFYGCFDWHSAVHSHWALIRLIRAYGVENEAEIRSHLRENLTEANLLSEAKYLDGPQRKGFERPYGWTWLLKLALELHTWEDEEGRRWREWIRPLEDRIVQRYIDFLPIQTYPIRVGTHANTAFGLFFALQYARVVQNEELTDVLERSARRYLADDSLLPMHWEPSGADFLSPSLMEAHLMSTILVGDERTAWLQRCLGETLPPSLTTPATVSDRSDGQISHLDGLNLSRAWNLKALGDKFSPLADKHLDAGLDGLMSGHYEGEHWLSSFALLALE